MDDELAKAALEAGKVVAPQLYQDLVQEFAKEMGKAGGTVGKAVNFALSPVRGLVWGFDHITAWLAPKVEKLLKNVQPERITVPSIVVAGPALEALRFASEVPDVRDMFANLIATAMVTDLAKNALPAYVEILKQITPDEARILKYLSTPQPVPAISVYDTDAAKWTVLGPGESRRMVRHFSIVADDAGCSNSDMVIAYLDNLERLGLLEIVEGRQYTVAGVYDRIEGHDWVKTIIEKVNSQVGRKAHIERHCMDVTVLGRHFMATCVLPPQPKNQ